MILLFFLIFGIVKAEELPPVVEFNVNNTRTRDIPSTLLGASNTNFIGRASSRCWYGRNAAMWTRGKVSGYDNNEKGQRSTTVAECPNSACSSEFPHPFSWRAADNEMTDQELTDLCLTDCSSIGCTFVHIHYGDLICYIFFATPCPIEYSGTLETNLYNEDLATKVINVDCVETLGEISSTTNMSNYNINGSTCKGNHPDGNIDCKCAANPWTSEDNKDGGEYPSVNGQLEANPKIHLYNNIPTDKPTSTPTETPTDAPTDAPTEAPTDAPTGHPTEAPTDAPTDAPTETPTTNPTSKECSDNMRQTDETDVDCGGPNCGPCLNAGNKCKEERDCASYVWCDNVGAGSTDTCILKTNSPTPFPTQVPTTYPTAHPTEFPTKHPTDAPEIIVNSILNEIKEDCIVTDFTKIILGVASTLAFTIAGAALGFWYLLERRKIAPNGSRFASAPSSQRFKGSLYRNTNPEERLSLVP